MREAFDQIRAHRDRCRRATKEFVAAEEDLNYRVDRLWQLFKRYRDGHSTRGRVASRIVNRTKPSTSRKRMI